MSRMGKAVAFSLILAGAPALMRAIELQSATLNAWDDYMKVAEARMQARLDPGHPFLWTDESPSRRLRLQRGEILVAPVAGRGAFSVPNGLIHHWIGAVFIPNATLDSLFAVVHDYDRYKQFYQPVVAESKVLACSPDDQEFSMVWQHKIMFINAAMEARYRAHDFSLGDHRGYNIATTTRVQEIEQYGKPDQRLLEPGTGNGFMWRIASIARYQERDGGVYLEIEGIALTRDIPASLRWMVNPVVNRISVNSLTTTLRQTRDAVLAVPPHPERLVSCAGHRTRGTGD